jgi:NAD(P)-dependent dehydrogenase (short-subunit alcohol dehydrogenase family)
VALVTGASRGIGAATAVALAAEGAHLLLAARTVGGLEDTDDRIRALGGSATLVPLDLASPEASEQLAAAIYERHGRLDVWVSAAAELGALTPLGHADPEAWNRVLDTNLHANWRLIRTLDPLLRRAPKAHALFATCTEGREARAYWGAYAVSKAGLEQLVGIWAAELRLTQVKAALIDPGPSATRLRAQAFPGEDPTLLQSPEDAARPFLAAID